MSYLDFIRALKEYKDMSPLEAGHLDEIYKEYAERAANSAREYKKFEFLIVMFVGIAALFIITDINRFGFMGMEIEDSHPILVFLPVFISFCHMRLFENLAKQSIYDRISRDISDLKYGNFFKLKDIYQLIQVREQFFLHSFLKRFGSPSVSKVYDAMYSVSYIFFATLGPIIVNIYVFYTIFQDREVSALNIISVVITLFITIMTCVCIYLVINFRERRMI